MVYEDRLVQELTPGMVTFRSTGETMPKEEYLKNLLEEFKELSKREKELRRELTARLVPYLHAHCPTGDRQANLRRIRWAIEEGGLGPVITKSLEGIPNQLALNSPEAYQLTDYIFTAICAAKEIQLVVIPEEAPNTAALKWTFLAPDKFAAVENRVQAWTKILRLFGPTNAPLAKRFGARSGQPQPQLQSALQRIEAKLDEVLNHLKNENRTPRTGKKRSD